VAGEVESGVLTAQIRVQRGGASQPVFVLDVSVAVPSGITILFGPSGSGKSTLLDCAAGLLRPTAGRIAVGDRVLFDSSGGVNLPPQQRRVAYVFQSLALFPRMSVEENVAYGLADTPEARRAERVDLILAAFRVAHLRSRKPGQISGGEQQRVALARSLVTLPQVLLLDEPLSRLDAELKASIVEDLRGWNQTQRIPILYVTHSRDEVDALAERVIAIERGRVIGQGHPREVLDAPRRTGLALAAGFENLLDATVVSLREADGVMSARLAETAVEIEVPLSYATPGDRVRIAVRAGDIMLATQHPSGLSARNVLEGQIESMEQRGTLVAVHVNCRSAVLMSHVTPGALRSLELSTGKTVWVVLKTHSCHLVSD
jgi:molybdate transport system ATP-binding protein